MEAKILNHCLLFLNVCKEKSLEFFTAEFSFFKYLHAYIAELGGVLVGLEYIETDD
jgi:hypothetical protein